MSDAFTRLQELLRQLFQFDNKDLDFGIYRIMNHKRGAVEDFIQNGLAAAVDEALKGGAIARQASQASRRAQAAQRQADESRVRAMQLERALRNELGEDIPLQDVVKAVSSSGAESGGFRGPGGAGRGTARRLRRDTRESAPDRR